MDENELYCYTCSIGFSSLVFLKEHTLSLMHHKVLDHQMKNKGTKRPEHHCFICKKSMLLVSWNCHIDSTKHRRQLELMKASIAHSGSWNDPPQPRHPPRSSSRPQSHSRSQPNSRPNSRSGSSDRFDFQAAAWKMSHLPPDAPLPPRRSDLCLPQRAFSPADSDESERRRQRDRAETEALLRKAQAMQEAFRRDRERQASREMQRDLHPGMEGPIVVGRAGKADVNVRPSSTVQQNGRGLKSFESPSLPDKDVPIELSRSPAVAPIKRTVELSKSTLAESEENGTSLFSNLSSSSRTKSVLGSISSVSLPVRTSPASPSVGNSKLTSAQDLFKSPSMLSKSSSAEIISKLGIASNPVQPPPRETAATAEHRASASSSSALLNVINSPRSRRERRQLADLLRTLPHPTAPTRRPRLNPSLSPSMMQSISQHEEGASKLPTLDLSIEEATSGVTSLSTTAREEENSEQLSEETERSNMSLVSPVAKKRKTGQMEVEEHEEEVVESPQSEEPLSEEVSRMQLALQLSVQQQAVHRKAELLNTDLSERYRQLEALQSKIESMEIELNKLRGEENDIHKRRMDVLKKSYLKPFGAKSSETSVTSASECSSSRVESVLSTSAMDHSVTSSDSQTDTVIAARPLKLKQEVEHIITTDDTEEGEEPLIGNLTAREIRERAMAMIGSGAMNFADLDDVLSELMDKVSGDLTEELQLDPLLQPHPEPQLQEFQKSAKKRRRYSKGSEAEQDSSSEHRTEPESAVSDVMSARPTASSKKDSERNGRKSTNSSHSEDSSSGTPGPPVPTFAGAIEAHNGPVHDLQLFRNCLYSCAEDASVKKFSPQSHECLKHFTGFSDSVRCLLVTEKPKGVPRVFSGGDEKILLVHEARSGKELQRLPMDSQISCMLLHWFSLFIGLSSGALIDMDVRKNVIQRSKRISDHPVRFVQHARKDSRSVLIVATSNGTLWLVDSSLKSDPQQILPPSRGGERPMQLHAVRDRLLFVTDAGRLRQLSLTGAASSNSAEDVDAEFGAKVCCFHVPTHGQHLLIGCRDGSIRLLDRENLTQVTKVYYTPGRYALTTLTANLNGNTGSMFAGNKNGQLFVIHVSKMSIACEFGDCKLTFGSRDDLVYHVTREHVLSASESDVSCLWAKTCKHRFDRTRSEDISAHVRLHV